MEQVKITPYSHELYELLTDFSYSVNSGNGVVPAGFKTNGANLPRFARWIWDCYSPSFISPVVVHDFLYGQIDKSSNDRWLQTKKADKIFYELLKQYGRSEITARAFWSALRIANAFRRLVA